MGILTAVQTTSQQKRKTPIFAIYRRTNGESSTKAFPKPTKAEKRLEISSSRESSSSSVRCENDAMEEVLELEFQNRELKNEMKKLEKDIQVSESQKLELWNKCQSMEKEISNYIRNSSSVRQLRVECVTMQEEKAKFEADFMNQINALSIQMRQKEEEHERILSDKDVLISVLETKLAAYQIMEYNGEIKSPYKGQNNVNPFGSNNKTINYLTSSLEQTRTKNSVLQEEVDALQELVRKLELKSSKVTSLEKELEESRNTLNSYQQSNEFLSDLDSQYEDELQESIIDSKREKDEFMKELQSLETDVFAEFQEMASELESICGTGNEDNGEKKS